MRRATKIETGRRLRNERMLKGYSQRLLARLSRTDHAHISNVENGNKTFSTAAKRRLCLILGCKVGRIFGELFYADDSLKKG